MQIGSMYTLSANKYGNNCRDLLFLLVARMLCLPYIMSEHPACLAVCCSQQ